MAGEWREVRIEEIAERVAMGPFGSSIKVETFVPEGVPVISGQHLHGFKVDDTVGFNFITPEHAERLKNANVQRGDIVLTHRGNIGQVAYIPDDSKYERYVVSQSQFYMRCDRSKAIPEFVVAFFKTPEGQHRLLANTSQVGVPSIAQPVTYLRTIEIPLPPLPEQRAIAHILGTLDDKIELNRRMSETLEAMARALFKSWFVDFDPVRAKAEGRDPGLPQPLADLFPDSFEDSELGEIPKGWEVGCVDDEFDLTMGQSPPGHTYNEIGDGVPFYQGRTDFGFRFPTRRVYCTAPTRLAKKGDTLISVRAPVGDINMAAEDCAIGRGVAAARHKTGSRSYSYQFMRAQADVFDRFEAEGTVFGAIGKKDFHAIACVVPPRGLVEEFERRVAPLDDRIEVTDQDSRTLAALRDALLPKLISGELRVKNIEEMIGRIV
jgi:type I restriction enzyme S subunit